MTLIYVKLNMRDTDYELEPRSIRRDDTQSWRRPGARHLHICTSLQWQNRLLWGSLMTFRGQNSWEADQHNQEVASLDRRRSADWFKHDILRDVMPKLTDLRSIRSLIWLWTHEPLHIVAEISAETVAGDRDVPRPRTASLQTRGGGFWGHRWSLGGDDSEQMVHQKARRIVQTTPQHTFKIISKYYHTRTKLTLMMLWMSLNNY